MGFLKAHFHYEIWKIDYFTLVYKNGTRFFL